jgi:FixJ family two-component response regulator
MSTEQRLVAVVDDDPFMLKAIQRLLTAHGFDVEAFVSAEAFLASEALKKANCLVLDISLGGMSGLELGRRLTASGHHLPTIFITAMDNGAASREAREISCVAYLPKPFPAAELIGAIARATA